MASSVIFLVHICVLLPLLAVCDESPPCVLPFRYRGRSYDSCTTDGAEDEEQWCATTPNYDRDHQRKICSTEEYGGNSGGEPCVFPFKYLGKTYYACTTKFSSNRKPWCATTGNYDRDRKWSYCAETRLRAGQTGPCVFPFTFKGRSYTTCTTDGSHNGEPWCSLTKNYDKDLQRISCEVSEPSHCVFPFTYKGKLHCSCTRKGSADGQLWCATTPNYDEDRKWKLCSTQEYGGNSDGQPCFFPFTYKEKTYTKCTNEDEPTGRDWCSTTQNYDDDGKWTFCRDASPEMNQDKECIFPFRYKGISYNTCTKDGSSLKKPWCSLTRNYDKDRKWKYCNFTDRESECSHQSSQY